MAEERWGYMINVPELRQRDVEAFQRARRELHIGNTAPENNGEIVRAAARLGWLSMAEGDVDGLKPYVVDWIADKVAEAYLAAYEIPGE